MYNCTCILHEYSLCPSPQVIIDEAGMCTEAQTLLPLVPTQKLNPDDRSYKSRSASADVERIILIGDHKQLRPIVMDKTAAQLGIERSMLERHWSRGQTNCVMLRVQYRMVRLHHESVRSCLNAYLTCLRQSTLTSHLHVIYMCTVSFNKMLPVCVAASQHMRICVQKSLRIPPSDRPQLDLGRIGCRAHPARTVAFVERIQRRGGRH